MFYCGDDAAAKTAASNWQLILVSRRSMRPLRVARLLEPYAMLWIHLAYAQKLGRDFVFRIVRR
jgi:hypothetical protein